MDREHHERKIAAVLIGWLTRRLACISRAGMEILREFTAVLADIAPVM
jgi:hypothetical protein